MPKQVVSEHSIKSLWIIFKKLFACSFSGFMGLKLWALYYNPNENFQLVDWPMLIFVVLGGFFLYSFSQVLLASIRGQFRFNEIGSILIQQTSKNRIEVQVLSREKVRNGLLAFIVSIVVFCAMLYFASELKNQILSIVTLFSIIVMVGIFKRVDTLILGEKVTDAANTK